VTHHLGGVDLDKQHREIERRPIPVTLQAALNGPRLDFRQVADLGHPTSLENVRHFLLSVTWRRGATYYADEFVTSPAGSMENENTRPALQAHCSGGGLGYDQDDAILIPLQTGPVRLFGSTSVNQIVLQLADNARMVTAYAANPAVALATSPTAGGRSRRLLDLQQQ
jgi:hypothetical protein